MSHSPALSRRVLRLTCLHMRGEAQQRGTDTSQDGSLTNFCSRCEGENLYWRKSDFRIITLALSSVATSVTAFYLWSSLSTENQRALLGLTWILHKIYTGTAPWTWTSGARISSNHFCDFQHCLAHWRCLISESKSECWLMLVRPYVLFAAAKLEYCLGLDAS